jgi:RimJ/RimL family protein N-acetyltransferase
MFNLDDVTLRPLETSDIESLYAWDGDIEVSVLGGWVRQQSRAAVARVWERRITEPAADMDWFGIEYEGKLAGYIQLALIDPVERRAMVGIAVGAKSLWGKGIGGGALRLLCDYAFTVRNLDRVYAEVFTFNTRSMRLFEGVGFQREGTLRQHEYHNGVRQDMHVYGILRDEFYARHPTIFRVPDTTPDA